MWRRVSVMLCACVALSSPTRPQRYRFNISHADVFSDNRVIPLEHQVSDFLYKGETKMFFFYNKRPDGPLSLTVTPCTSSLHWSLRYRNHTHNSESEEVVLGEFRGREVRTASVGRAAPGLYIVQATPLERESFVQLYASRRPQGPHALTMRHRPRLRLQRRHRPRSITVRWEPSQVDPHLMHYCVVVNTRRPYSTLCEAQGERWGVAPPPRATALFPHEHKSELASKAARHAAPLHEDIVVGCVGRKTQYTLCDLQQGKVYHLNLFAINRRTNLTFSYGSTTLKYKEKTRPLKLKDGKRATVSLRHLDGRAAFKFIVPRSPEPLLQVAVVPCGGAVDVKLKRGADVVALRTRVLGYGVLTVPAPKHNQSYVLHVAAPNREELRRVTALQVLATAHPSRRFPWPPLPSDRRVHEYESLRGCRSLTVGWQPSVPAAYCLHAAPALGPPDATPNQCALLRRPPQHQVCLNSTTEGKVSTHTLEGLEPGTRYVVQVTLQQPGGAPLSYDLLHASTHPSCT